VRTAAADRDRPGARESGALVRIAETSGNDWAAERVAALHGQGRELEGGFPGTVSEARERLSRVVAGTRDARLPHAVIEALVRITYQAAKRFWLQRSVREKPDA
jgi:hypothetical protein